MLSEEGLRVLPTGLLVMAELGNADSGCCVQNYVDVDMTPPRQMMVPASPRRPTGSSFYRTGEASCEDTSSSGDAASSNLTWAYSLLAHLQRTLLTATLPA